MQRKRKAVFAFCALAFFGMWRGALAGEKEVSEPAAQPASSASAIFVAGQRAVSTWQSEAAANLELTAANNALLDSGAGFAGAPRCVKLNNYWCIKRARWAGQIAADPEGHVAFASALDGAVAAALLVRRYYFEFNRRSAAAILSHWAPSQCGSLKTAARLPQLAAIAPFGIEKTLRARWLAARRQKSPAAAKPLRRSTVRAAPVIMMRAPEIAIGMGEPRRAPMSLAALELPSPPAQPQASSAGCGGEALRLQNYAARAIEGIAASAADDLKLLPDPGPRDPVLERLLLNMAKVEIGPFAPRAALVSAAIARLAQKGGLAPQPSQPGRTTR